MLATGTRLGPYEVLSPLGQGGMGEVYRARDTRLDRTVAIKVLPAGRANDPHFRERFEREARAVSSLNHPNICVLHDIGNEGGVAYLIMECLEGESLAARLERGALPMADALRYAIEIASALDAAHRRGVVHRDLKPGNIMLTKTGAKLLDFGLAKMNAVQASAAEHTAAITVTTEGSLVGTFQYMSPEQLEGHEADARSDIFAFGATLHEMLTGKRAFTGPSQASLIGAILRSEPEGDIPGPLGRMLKMCLAKSPDDRWQSAGDLVHELRWIQQGDAAAVEKPPARLSSTAFAWIAAAVCAAAAVAFGIALLRHPPPAPPRAVRFDVLPPEGMRLVTTRPVVSPDGQSVLYAALDGNIFRLYLHNLASGTSRALTGFEGYANAVWSFDSRSLILRAGATGHMRLDLNGSPPQPLSISLGLNDPAWGPPGILDAEGHELSLYAADGSGHRVLKRDPAANFAYPSWLPDGRWLLYNVPATGGANIIHALSADGKDDRTLGRLAGAPAIYASSGYLVFLRAGVLMAQAVDLQRMQLRGAPLPVADHIAVITNTNFGAYSVSNNDVLAFRPGTNLSDTRLVWMDRSGNLVGSVGEPGDYTSPALSPDGTRLAVGRRDPTTQSRDIWIFDLLRNSSTRLTSDPADDLNPTWSPDGTRIAFTSDRRSVRTAFVKNAAGTGDDQMLIDATVATNVEDWSPDGRWIVFNRGIPSRGLWLLSMETHKAEALLEGDYTLDHARFSPDGRWLAYRSTENGQSEIYVQPFRPGTSARALLRWKISNGGGDEPQWRGDGKELYFLSPDLKIMAVDLAEKDGAIVPGLPHPLFAVRVNTPVRNRYLPAPDGKKFLVVQAPEPKPVTSFTVIVNWPALLRK